MKNVLWISRHGMTDEQLQDLDRVCRDRVCITQVGETITDVQSLCAAVAAADVIAAVLPTQLLAELVTMAAGKSVLVAHSIRTLIPQSTGDPAVCFRHGGWKRIARLEYEECDL